MPSRDDARQYVRCVLRETRLAFERTNRPMALGGTGLPLPRSADVPLCLVGLLTAGDRYLDALRDAAYGDGTDPGERAAADFCLGYLITSHNSGPTRFRISFEGATSDDDFCHVSPAGPR